MKTGVQQTDVSCKYALRRLFCKPSPTHGDREPRFCSLPEVVQTDGRFHGVGDNPASACQLSSSPALIRCLSSSYRHFGLKA
jgi:hypothetical protein